METIIFFSFFPARHRKEPPTHNIRPHHDTRSHSPPFCPINDTRTSYHLPAHSSADLPPISPADLLCLPPYTLRSKRYHCPYMSCTMESNNTTYIMEKRIHPLELLPSRFVYNRPPTSPEDTICPGTPKYVISQRWPG
jgi:hypothetical protein